MPNPNVVITVAVPPLPGLVVIDCNVQLALQMVERLLGAAPTPGVAAPRRPSEVEADLIAFLAHQAVSALTETLQPLVDVELRAELESIEFNPQLVQVAAPSDMSLLLSYRVGVSGGLDANGFLTVAYPGPVMNPLLELLEARRNGDDDAADDDRARGAVTSALSEVGLTLAVQLNTSPVPASDIGALQVGDVLRLDHRVDAPARGVVGGEDVLLAHIGRRGTRLAVQVREWVATPPLVAVDPPPSRRSTDLAHVGDALTDRTPGTGDPAAPVTTPDTHVMEPAS